MHTITYLSRTKGTPKLFTICTPSVETAWFTWYALTESKATLRPRMWHAGKMIAGLH